MHLRRPLATLLTALALFGGGATLTGCGAAGDDQRDGTTDDEVNQGPGPGPNFSDPHRDVEQGEDNQDPD
ncbi:hypothetical protein [Trujillonella humicola]|uniref:hypothetical protein n=1 Tax=Trujillonella humicola TaxID=3383699 RepID=UPI0039061C00